MGNVRGDVGCARSSVVHSSGSAPRHRDGEEEDTVEGVAVPEGETVRDLQDQKTHVQSSEALAYLARFLFSFASFSTFFFLLSRLVIASPDANHRIINERN